MEDNNNNGHGRNDKLLLVGVLFLIVSLLFITIQPKLTGMFTLNGEIENVLELNKTYTINTTEQLGINDTITSIRFNGQYVGQFKLWLNDSGRLLLIAESGSKNNGSNLITGLEIADVGESAPPITTGVSEEPASDVSDNKSIEEQSAKQPAIGPAIDSNISDVVDTDVEQNVSEEEITNENILSNESLSSDNSTSDVIGNISNVSSENISENISIGLNETNVDESINESIHGESINDESSVNMSVLNESTLNESAVNESIVNGSLTNMSIINESELNESIIIESLNETLSNESVTNNSVLENLTENESVESITNISNVSIVLNISSEPIILLDECIDTCRISVNMSQANLIIELSENSILSIDSIIYTQVAPITINDTNMTVETTQYPARVGEPVKWVKKASRATEGEITVDIPSSAFNVSTYKRLDKTHRSIVDSVIEQQPKKSHAAKGSKSAGNDAVNTDTAGAINNETIRIQNYSTNIEIEYYTEAPTSTESMVSENQKQVVVSSDVHYANVTVNSKLPYEVKDTSMILLNWIINSSDDVSQYNLSSEEMAILNDTGSVEINLPFTAIDSDGNGLYDSIEWTAPHLSDQTFEIIIITKADLLDENRTYKESIYEQVKDKDDVWANVPDNNYVRVTFEKNLTSMNDITIYARAQSEDARIEVYEKDKNVSIAEFTDLTKEKYYKIYLSNLQHSQDVFDLRIINGTVGIDNVIDPPNIISACGAVSSSGEYVLNQSITGATTCLTVNVDNVDIDCQGYTIAYDTGGTTTKIGIDAIDGTNARTNLTVRNCVLVKASNLQTAGSGIRLTRYSDSKLINNTIYTNGTTNNYGIYLTTYSSNNLVENNTIYSKGSTTGNAGIALITGCNNNVLKHNYIYTNGTTTGYGIYVYGLTSPSDNNIIISNIINTSGSGANNHGIYLYRNVSYSNVSYNIISTNGTTTNHGIYVLGTTDMEVNYNLIDSNVIYASGNTTPTAYGVWLSTNANYNNVTYNNISTSGTTANYGIYILGTAALASNNNLAASNIIRTNGTTTNNYGIYLAANVNFNNVSYNDIATQGTSGNDGIYVSGDTFECNNSDISHNIISTSGSAGSNYGIYLYRNVNYHTVTANDIFTSGTTTDHGIYAVGTTSEGVNYNIIDSNVINASGYAEPSSNTGIWLSTNSNYNNVTHNNVTAPGTTGSYGIYILGSTALTSNNNVVSSNIAMTYGNSTNNRGIVLSTNANSNNVSYNVISTLGTSGNYGVYILGTATITSDNNTIFSNNISATGSTSDNYGVFIATNANSNIITNNNVSTSGTTLNYGIYISGNTFASNNTEISYNNISTSGSTVSNYGIYLYRNVHSSNVTGNIVSTSGTSTSYGIYLLGNAASALNNNVFASNILNVSNADRINIATGSWNTTIKNNSIINKDYSYYDVRISAAGINETSLIDQYLDNYTFAGAGDKINVENSLFGRIVFLNPVTGSGAKLSNDINISQNYIYVNSTQAGLNKPSILSLYNLSFVDPVILKDGALCLDCVILDYTNGTIVFNVTGFSSYSVDINTNLSIWDDTDSITKYMGEQIKFYANYSNKTGGPPINGTDIYCEFSDNSTGSWSVPVNMTLNDTSMLYEYNKSFASAGNYSFNVSCNAASGYDNLTAIDLFNVSIIVNTPSVITNITSIPAQDPIESLQKIITFNFNVDDAQGNDTINVSSAIITVNNSGIVRQSSVDSCIGTPINITAQNISCNISLQYYDPAGVWSINISMEDTMGDYIEDTSTTFTYNLLYAVALNTNLLDFGSLNAGDINKTTGVLLLNNTGNFNYTQIQLKAFNLVNGSDFINASNFRINITNVSSGTALSNDTFVNISDAILPRSTDSTIGNQSMYMYVDVPLGTPAKKYTSPTEWILSLN